MRSTEASVAQMKLVVLLDSVLRCSCICLVVGDNTSSNRVDDGTCGMIDCSCLGHMQWRFTWSESGGF